MMGYKKASLLTKNLVSPSHFRVLFLSGEPEGLTSDTSTSSILINGHYKSNVYISISFLGPSDVYSSTLSSLNFNLWPHLTDQMVFPKINHGFLSADQQLIKRRLIKVVLVLAWVGCLLFVPLLLCVLLLYHLPLRGGAGVGVGRGVFIWKHPRIQLCLVSCICLKCLWKYQTKKIWKTYFFLN